MLTSPFNHPWEPTMSHIEIRGLEEADPRCYRAQLIRQLVAYATGIPESALLSPSRSRAKVALARQVAMYVCHVVAGLSHLQVGRLFGRDRTTAAHACEVVEDRRDDPVFDAWLERIEHVAESLPGPEASVFFATTVYGRGR